MSRNMLSMSGLAGVIAVSVSTWIPTASSGSPSPAGAEARYLPVQSMSYEFGSKTMSGYFVAQSSACVVTIMVAEKGAPEGSATPSPTRVRLVLYPGQIAGLDSEEGRSLNFRCDEDAATLLVSAGDRDDLVALQALALTKDIAGKQ